MDYSNWYDKTIISLLRDPQMKKTCLFWRQSNPPLFPSLFPPLNPPLPLTFFLKKAILFPIWFTPPHSLYHQSLISPLHLAEHNSPLHHQFPLQFPIYDPFGISSYFTTCPTPLGWFPNVLFSQILVLHQLIVWVQRIQQHYRYMLYLPFPIHFPSKVSLVLYKSTWHIF